MDAGVDEVQNAGSKHANTGHTSSIHGGMGEAPHGTSHGDGCESAPQDNSLIGTELLIPKSLTARRNFNDWWLKYQEQYKTKGCPLTAYEQSEVLAMLARNPFTAVEKLKYSVVNFETSYAARLAPRKTQPTNSS